MTTQEKPVYLNSQETADYLGVNVDSLAVWRSTKRHKIPYTKVGKWVRYKKADLDKWLESRVVDKFED
jgi:excisionase family DNA binding protein